MGITLWGGMVWCNPPYGRKIKDFVRKGYISALLYKSIVVMLLPSRTDTKWFHDYCVPYGEIFFIKGRLTFKGAKNPAPFPSMIVVFNGRKE